MNPVVDEPDRGQDNAGVDVLFMKQFRIDSRLRAIYEERRN